MEKIFNRIRGPSVLFVWKRNSSTTENAETYNEHLRHLVGKINGQLAPGKAHLENAERLSLSAYSPSSFDSCAFYADLYPSFDDLERILRYMKPSSSLLIIVSPNDTAGSEECIRDLKLTGFSVDEGESTISDDKTAVITAKKPSFETGVAVPLKTTAATSSNNQKTWVLTAKDVTDDDLINEDELLTDEDFARPVSTTKIPADCGTGNAKKRKACKNCTCGLAEELDNERPNAASTQVKSSCGSCFLGDAFRCSSCPYLGMPPFKPGEEVKLAALQLPDDI